MPAFTSIFSITSFANAASAAYVPAWVREAKLEDLVDAPLEDDERKVPDWSCASSGVVQFHHVGYCFVRAANYAQQWALPPHDIFVRMRPDIIFELPPPPPWDFLNGAADRRPLVSHIHRDILFALTRTSLRNFLGGGGRQFNNCSRAHWLEHWDYLSRGTRGSGVVDWNICYALVRDRSWVEPNCLNSTRSAALMNYSQQLVAADPSLLRCDLEPSGGGSQDRD
jgi:hypothetical protein